MRILHVVPSYVPAWRYGGPIRSVHGLCKALRDAGHDVEVYTTNADGSADLDVPIASPVDVEGVKVWYFPTRMRRLYWSPQMGKALERNVASFSIVHLHSIYLWPTMAGARAARRAGVPYVLSPRGMLIAALMAGRSRWVKAAWIHLVERRNLAHAAATHFTSEGEAAEARQLQLPIGRTFVVPNGSDSPSGAAVPGTPPPEVASLGMGYLLFIGRLSWEKGLDRLLAALKHIPDRRLVIAGQGPMETKLRELAREHGVADRVTFAGMVEGTAKAWLLRGAALLVLPSYAESFGNVVLEAMAEGRPAVVTPEVGAAEVVRSSGAGQVIAGEPETLGRGIAALLSNPEALDEMGRRGRAAFEERFTWRAVGARMADSYRSIIQGAGS